MGVVILHPGSLRRLGRQCRQYSSETLDNSYYSVESRAARQTMLSKMRRNDGRPHQFRIADNLDTIRRSQLMNASTISDSGFAFSPSKLNECSERDAAPLPGEDAGREYAIR
jgi:hypothetical protein